MPLPKSATIAARATEVYSEVCPLVLQEVCPREGDDEAAPQELPRLLPFLRQLLTCCACAGLLEEAMISLTCGHCYCYECQFKDPVLKILCRQCRERKALVVENQLRLVVSCYRKLMQTLALSAKWKSRECVTDPKDPNFSPIPEIIREVTEGVKVSRSVLIVRPPERFLNVRQFPTPKKEVVGNKKVKLGEKGKSAPKNPLTEHQSNAQKKIKLASKIVKRRLQYSSSMKQSVTSVKSGTATQRRKKALKLHAEESVIEEETGWTSTTESQDTISDDDYLTKMVCIQSLELSAGSLPPLEVTADCLCNPPAGKFAHFEPLVTQLMQKWVKRDRTKSCPQRTSGWVKLAKHSRTPFSPRSRWHVIQPGTHRHPRSRKKHAHSTSLAVLQLKTLSSPGSRKSSRDAVVVTTTPTGKASKVKPPHSAKLSHKKVTMGTSGPSPKKSATLVERNNTSVVQLPIQNISLPIPSCAPSLPHMITASPADADKQAPPPLVTAETPPRLGSVSSTALPIDLSQILAQAAATAPPKKKKKKKKKKKVPTSYDCKLTAEEIEELRQKPRFRCRCGTNPGVMFLDMICCKRKCPCFLNELPCLRCKCRGCNNPFNRTMVTVDTGASTT